MRRAHVLVVVLVLLCVAASAAHAKGASEASISGPGLDGPLALEGSGEPGSGATLGVVAEAAGFFEAVFGQSPDPMRDRGPAGALGLRYRITYLMPGPSGESDTLVQDVYPYARPHAVTYTPPDQAFWDGQRTRGGWFIAYYDDTLREALVAAGLPARPPTTSASGTGRDRRWVLALLGGGAVVVVASAVVVLRRRPTRDQTKTVTASRSAS